MFSTSHLLYFRFNFIEGDEIYLEVPFSLLLGMGGTWVLDEIHIFVLKMFDQINLDGQFMITDTLN